MDTYMALKAFKEFKDVADSLEIEFFLIYGTLLGAIRDKGFVKGDTDIDVGVKHEELIPKIQELRNKLLEKGFVVYGFSYPYDYCRALNIYKYETLIDIRNFETVGEDTFLQRIDSNRFDIANVFPKEIFTPYRKIQFYNMKVNVPQKAEKWLEINYGDWKTPDSEFHRSIAGKEGWWKGIGRKVLVHDGKK